jgi:hypothetical protein
MDLRPLGGSDRGEIGLSPGNRLPERPQVIRTGAGQMASQPNTREGLQPLALSARTFGNICAPVTRRDPVGVRPTSRANGPAIAV